MIVDLDRFRIAPGSKVSLSELPTSVDGGLSKDASHEAFREGRRQLADLQEKLYAEGEQSLLLVLQAMDTAGKDSTIRSVTKGVNPQGCRVYSFKVPSAKELARDFLWRVHHQVPPRGHIGIFNRSHYEDVLVVRVKQLAPAPLIERRYDHINQFEKLLVDHGTRIVKVMLHISKDYQLARLRRRLERPDKQWKFNPGDLKERARWDDYMRAYEIMLERCSTEHSAWYVVPAERRWFRNLLITNLLLHTLHEMNPQTPDLSYSPTDYPPESLV
jgi:PPK2 family polyphosphate:nucleotide phosphotransferase